MQVTVIQVIKTFYRTPSLSSYLPVLSAIGLYSNTLGSDRRDYLQRSFSLNYTASSTFGKKAQFVLPIAELVCTLPSPFVFNEIILFGALYVS